MVTYKTCFRCCWDRDRVEQREMAEGCTDWTAVCPFGQLHDALAELDMVPTTRAAAAEFA